MMLALTLVFAVKVLIGMHLFVPIAGFVSLAILIFVKTRIPTKSNDKTLHNHNPNSKHIKTKIVTFLTKCHPEDVIKLIKDAKLRIQWTKNT